MYALGRTEAGRYLFVVLSPLSAGRVRCGARDRLAPSRKA
jgi:hypothetical protein